MLPRIGYELDKLLVEPPEYWAFRIRNGRRVAKFGPFSTEEEVRAKLAQLIEEKQTDAKANERPRDA